MSLISVLAVVGCRMYIRNFTDLLSSTFGTQKVCGSRSASSLQCKSVHQTGAAKRGMLPVAARAQGGPQD